MPKLDKEVSQKLRLAHSNLSIRKRASSRCSPEPPASRPASRVSVARTSSAAPVATPAAPPPPLSARAVNGTTPRASPTPRAAAPPLPSRSLPVNKALQQPAEGDDDFEDLDVWIHSQYYAAGGQKKKALEALSGDMDGLSIHQVQEVSKISSGSARCDVKIEFYRDHYHLSDPLQRYVEKAFMCAHHRTGETIVDVAKLRKSGRGYTRLVKEREQNEAGEDGEEAEIKRPISQQTTRSNVMARSRPPTVVTPEMTMSSLRQHALERDRRIDRTVARAREMQIAKRLQQLAKWQSAQSRHARAERERPWLRVAALASVLQIMAKSLSVFHHIKHTVHGKVNHAYDMKVLAWESVQFKTAQILWQSAQFRVHGGGITGLNILKPHQLETIENSVAEMRAKAEKEANPAASETDAVLMQEMQEVESWQDVGDGAITELHITGLLA